MAETSTSPSANHNAPSKSKYRPEIDGIRAFAVVAVIINHFNKSLLPSGYLGVDIFFVISGYVITSSLADSEPKTFRDFLAGFYERRVKRLVPALAFFVLITSVLICFFIPEPSATLSLGWKALLGASNISLYMSSTDYFAESTELNPYTHTWSLGVEEQFYLLFPFLVWLSGFGQQKKNGSKNLLLWAGALSIASIGSFIYLYQSNQPAAYFLMPPRFWEMAAGCLVFITLQKRGKIGQALQRVPPMPVLAGMAGAMLLLPSSAAVPATILIVLLSGLIIACTREGTAIYAFLSIKSVVYIGLISYSLYLWHWSILCISRWTIGIHLWTAPFQIGLMLLMAIGSYHLIEKPLRTRAYANRRVTLQLAAVCAGTVATSIIAGGETLSNRLYSGHYPHENLLTRSRNNFSGSGYTGKNCHLDKSASTLPTTCQIKGGNEKTFYFVGNSHTDHYRETHFLLNKLLGLTIDGISVSSCVFPPNPRQTACGLAQNRQEDRVLSNLNQGDVIVIANRYVINDDSDEWMETEASLASLNRFAVNAINKGGSVILFGPLPEFKVEAKQCNRLWFRPFQNPECETALDATRQARTETMRLLQKIDKRIFFFDPMKAICPNNQCRLIDKDGKPLFVDKDHLTDYANQHYIYPSFKEFLSSNHLI